MRYAPIAIVFLCQVAFSYFTYIWLTFTFVEVKDMILLNMQQIKSEIGAFQHVEESKTADITPPSYRKVRAELVRELWSDDDPTNTKDVDQHSRNISSEKKDENLVESGQFNSLSISQDCFFWKEEKPFSNFHKFVLDVLRACPILNIHPVIDIVQPRMLNKGLFLEFGVFQGTSIRYMANKFVDRTIHGFDSFEGLPEKWERGGGNFDKGHFAVQNLPDVPTNVVLHKGWFHETLPDITETLRKEGLALIHIDCDLYSSTVTVFKHLKPFILSGTIIVFDELLNYPGYQNHELLAFWELLHSNNWKVKILGKFGPVVACPTTDDGAQYASVVTQVL